MKLGDFFTPEAGQSRRAWLDALDGRIDETLAYYLGPQLMPRVRGAVGAANELTDFADYRDAVLGADQMATGSTTADRIAGAGTMATGLAAMMVPGVSARMAEGATDVAGDLARFIADEDGGIRVWHGSPHDFDKFSMDKIGTGEGAQAYGHGLYFAENEGVARSYRDALSASTSPVTVVARTKDGTEIPWHQLTKEENALLAHVSDHGGDYQKASDTLSDVFLPQAVERKRAILRALQERGIVPGKPGRLYEVDLHANPEDFLDWDAPLSAQPDRVRDLLSDFGARAGDTGQQSVMRVGRESYPIQGADGRWGPGGATYEESLAAAGGDPSRVRRVISGDPASRSDVLRQAGIPGIRYLDQGSRGVGDGTRNYVVFDENIIEIVKKYGIAGAAAMLGLSAADVEAQVAAQPVSIGDWLSNNDTATLQEYLQ